MKFTFQPITSFSLILYLIGSSFLAFGWADQLLEVYWLSDKLRIQLFILAIIFIAVAAIFNLSKYIMGMYPSIGSKNNKNNSADDH